MPYTTCYQHPCPSCACVEHKGSWTCSRTLRITLWVEVASESEDWEIWIWGCGWCSTIMVHRHDMFGIPFANMLGGDITCFSSTKSPVKQLRPRHHHSGQTKRLVWNHLRAVVQVSGNWILFAINQPEYPCTFIIISLLSIPLLLFVNPG